jgi:glycosyltransferase involved in cell wall biosynthesis
LFDPQRLSTTEAIIDYETGFLVDSDNIEDITDEVVKILQDPELAKSLGENGKERAVEFDWDKKAAQFENAFLALEKII